MKPPLLESFKFGSDHRRSTKALTAITFISVILSSHYGIVDKARGLKYRSKGLLICLYLNTSI
jgi:hypothetical protein